MITGDLPNLAIGGATCAISAWQKSKSQVALQSSLKITKVHRVFERRILLKIGRKTMQENRQRLVLVRWCFLFLIMMPYCFAQAPAAVPRLFGTGVISTPDFEFNASFTPDGSTVYFSKSDAVYSRITIVVSHRIGGHWSEPEVASFSGIWKDTDPFVAPDGKRLFFSSTRPTDGSSSPRKDYDIWYAERNDSGSWGEPRHLDAPVNSDASELYPSVTRDGTLYFSAARPDHPGVHLYRSRLLDGKYSEPELLPFSTQANDLDATIAADETFIVFVSRDRGGLGQGDLFVSFRRLNGSWSVPKNLGAPISSPFNEIATGLSPDNHMLYFASNRMEAPPPRKARITYQQLEQELHAIENGLLHIYEVDISDLKRLDDGQ